MTKGVGLVSSGHKGPEIQRCEHDCCQQLLSRQMQLKVYHNRDTNLHSPLATAAELFLNNLFLKI